MIRGAAAHRTTDRSATVTQSASVAPAVPSPARRWWVLLLVSIAMFGNYYAYDDGTAENAYGVDAASSQVAYLYTPYKAD